MAYFGLLRWPLRTLLWGAYLAMLLARIYWADLSVDVLPPQRVFEVLGGCIIAAGCWKMVRTDQPLMRRLVAVMSAFVYLSIVNRSGIWGLNNELEFGMFRVNGILLFITLLSAVIVSLLLYRLLEDRRDKERLGAELVAAREVQLLLLGSVTGASDWAVEAEYIPAQEVGGDFYQLCPAGDGSLLLVTGDVSGKGLQAAMLVATVAGALGDLASGAPADVLGHLNRSLRGKSRGGFVTCCAALFHPDGNVDIANAGHLSPYMDSIEVAVDAGLPLGLAPDVAYSQTSIDIHNGTLTILSDGVVEAADSKGELFGFERTRAISNKPAAEIAAAAQAWGQNDDITVVTIRRTG